MNFTRYGIGRGLYSNERLHHSDGDRDQALDQQQIAVSMREHLKLLVIDALLNSHVDLRDMLVSQGRYEMVDLITTIIDDRNDFAALQKVEYGYNHVFNKKLRAMRKYGGDATTLIANREISPMFAQRPELTEWWRAGPQGQGNATDYDRGLATNTPLPNIIYMDYNPAAIGATMGPLQRATQIGGWHISKDLDELRIDPAYAAKYSSQCRSIRIFNQEVNAFVVISLNEMQAYSKIFSFDTGDVDTSDPSIPFLFGVDTFGAIPVRYYSNEDLKLTINVISHRIAESNGIRAEELKGDINRGLQTIIKINNAPPNKGWLEGLFIVSQSEWEKSSQGMATFKLPSLTTLARSLDSNTGTGNAPVPTEGGHSDPSNVNYLEFPVSSFTGYGTWEGLKLLDEYYQSKKNHSKMACPDDWESIHNFVCAVEQIISYWRSTFHGVQSIVSFELEPIVGTMGLRKSAEESLVDQTFNLNANFGLWMTTTLPSVPAGDQSLSGTKTLVPKTKKDKSGGGGGSAGFAIGKGQYISPFGAGNSFESKGPARYNVDAPSRTEVDDSIAYGTEMAKLKGFLLYKKTESIINALKRKMASKGSQLTGGQLTLVIQLLGGVESRINGYGELTAPTDVVYDTLPTEYRSDGVDTIDPIPAALDTWLRFYNSQALGYLRNFDTAAYHHWALVTAEDFDALLLVLLAISQLLDARSGALGLEILDRTDSEISDIVSNVLDSLHLFGKQKPYENWTNSEVTGLIGSQNGQFDVDSSSAKIPLHLRTTAITADAVQDLGMSNLLNTHAFLADAFKGFYKLSTLDTSTSTKATLDGINAGVTDALIEPAFVTLGASAGVFFEMLQNRATKTNLTEYLEENTPFPLLNDVITNAEIIALFSGAGRRDPYDNDIISASKHEVTKLLVASYLASGQSGIVKTISQPGEALTLGGHLKKTTYRLHGEDGAKPTKATFGGVRSGNLIRTPISVSFEQAKNIVASFSGDPDTTFGIGPASNFIQPFADAEASLNVDVYSDDRDFTEADLPFFKTADRLKFGIAGDSYEKAPKKHRYDGLYGYRSNSEKLEREERLTELLPKLQPFDKLIAVLYCSTDMTTENLQSHIDNNVPYPFNYMVVRPWMNYTTETIILVYPGLDNCGMLGIAGADEEQYRTGVTKESGTNASVWIGPTVFMPQNVLPLPNIAVVNYGHGGGVLFYTSPEQVANKQIRCNTRTPISSKGSISCLSFAIAKTESPKQEWLSITGRLPLQPVESGSPQYEETEDHFSTAQYYNKVWGFTSEGIVAPHYHDATLRGQENFEGNSICWRGTTFYWNPLGHKPDWNVMTLNAGPLGRDEGTGSQEIRQGNANFKVFNYENTPGLLCIA